jgi:hypothetical protein
MIRAAKKKAPFPGRESRRNQQKLPGRSMVGAGVAWSGCGCFLLDFRKYLVKSYLTVMSNAETGSPCVAV